MAILAISVDATDSSFVQESTLEGTTYRFVFRWNVREGAWYLTLRTLDDEEIAPSRKLVPGADLLRYVTGSVRPLGTLVMHGTPSRDSLGKSAVLVYATSDEL
jgi:hypothetical protein